MASPTLKLHLLGSFAAEVEGETMPPLYRKKSLWALALLALRQGHEVPRDWLAVTLWPDSERTRALFNLRHALTTDLRPTLGSAASLLRAPTKSTLCLDESGVWVDVSVFDTAIASGSIPALQTAVNLYRGPLLEGCLEEWVHTERTTREQAFQDALERLGVDALAQGKPAAAVGYLRRLLAAAPLRESGYAGLMEALAASGDGAGVRQVYRDLRVLLHRELHAEPAPQTRALFERLQQPAAQPSLSEPARSGVPTPSADSSVSPVSSPPRRLPIPLTRLIGRERNAAEVAHRFTQDRMVTLVGAGGVGKTRLAIAVAEALTTEFADGVWFVELAALVDPGLVVETVAQALQVKEQPGQTITETLAAALSSRSLLLVLDNCEHLLDACARLTEALLSQCASLRVLATSRQALGLFGEWVYRVPSLEVPPLPETGSGSEADKKLAARLLEYDASRLFVERAATQSTALPLAASQSRAVAEICARLDGIPLAIEMAAARVRSLSVEQINARLDNRFRLLSGGSRSALPRHRTLQALIDWSYDLLTPAEQTLLGRLSVFAGGWTLEAAEQVCCAEEGVESGEQGVGSREWRVGKANAGIVSLDSTSTSQGRGARNDAPSLAVGPRDLPPTPCSLLPSHVLDLLAALVDKSLVIYEEGVKGTRYRMLETVREYALQKHLEREEAGTIEVRHRDWYLALAEEANSKLKGPEQVAWLRRLETEHDNLRAALSWSLKSLEESRRVALRLCGLLYRFWSTRGYLREGRQWCAAALASEGSSSDAAERANVLGCAGKLAYRQGDGVSARAYHEQSLAIGREIGDRAGIASSLGGMGNVAAEQGDYASARAYFEQSLAIRREIGERQGIAIMLHNLGTVASEQGDYASARAYYEQSLAISREIGDPQRVALTLNNLGALAEKHGDDALARAYFEQNLAIFREIGNQFGVAVSLSAIGILAEKQGDYASARAYFEQSLAINREIGDRHGIAFSLNGLGLVAESQRSFASARVHFSQSLAIRHEIGDRRDIAESLEGLARLEVAQGALDKGVRLWGAAEALREQIDSPLPPNDWEACERERSAAREAMGEDAFAAAWAQGRAMSVEQAVAYALDERPADSESRSH